MISKKSSQKRIKTTKELKRTYRALCNDISTVAVVCFVVANRQATGDTFDCTKNQRRRNTKKNGSRAYSTRREEKNNKHADRRLWAYERVQKKSWSFARRPILYSETNENDEKKKQENKIIDGFQAITNEKTLVLLYTNNLNSFNISFYFIRFVCALAALCTWTHRHFTCLACARDMWQMVIMQCDAFMQRDTPSFLPRRGELWTDRKLLSCISLHWMVYLLFFITFYFVRRNAMRWNERWNDGLEGN